MPRRRREVRAVSAVESALHASAIENARTPAAQAQRSLPDSQQGESLGAIVTAGVAAALKYRRPGHDKLISAVARAGDTTATSFAATHDGEDRAIFKPSLRRAGPYNFEIADRSLIPVIRSRYGAAHHLYPHV